MCEFASGIAFRSGGLIWHPGITHSHEHLVDSEGLNDEDQRQDPELRTWVRFEWRPAYTNDCPIDYAYLDGYTLRIDEITTPMWAANVDWRAALVADLKQRMSRIVLSSGKYGRLLNRQLILCGDVQVEALQGCHVYAMCGTAKVKQVEKDTYLAAVFHDAKIGVMRGSIDRLHGNASIRVAGPGSRIGKMHGSAYVDCLDSGYIAELFDDAIVHQATREAVIGWCPEVNNRVESDNRINRSSDPKEQTVRQRLEDAINGAAAFLNPVATTIIAERNAANACGEELVEAKKQLDEANTQLDAVSSQLEKTKIELEKAQTKAKRKPSTKKEASDHDALGN